ncbi:MAG: ABC transporter substrate-binding protein [Dehalococcoidia bacterium]|nr:ABC transporter substrate-binding protein [Dehalococcoidia bacterium]
MTPPATTPGVTTPAAITTPIVSQEPVRIGVLTSWSGGAARAGNLVDEVLKIINTQLKEAGGINVGGVMRPVNWIKQDDATKVSDTVTGYKKLALDNVAVVAVGGATAASLTAASDAAEDNKVPLVSVGSTPENLSDLPFTVRGIYPNASDVSTLVSEFVLNNFKPKKVGFLSVEMQDIHHRVELMKGLLEAAGVTIGSEQYYDVGTVDFSALLTRIKHDNPDVLITNTSGMDTTYQAIFKQIPSLGGWGDIKVVAGDNAATGPASKEVGADGTYSWTLWTPGLPDSGSKAFERVWVKTYPGSTPSGGHVAMYQTLWVALKGVELAGSDNPAKIAQALRSGNFQWDNAPGGSFKINRDGTHNFKGVIVLLKDGKANVITD